MFWLKKEDYGSHLARGGRETSWVHVLCNIWEPNLSKKQKQTQKQKRTRNVWQKSVGRVLAWRAWHPMDLIFSIMYIGHGGTFLSIRDGGNQGHFGSSRLAWATWYGSKRREQELASQCLGKDETFSIWSATGIWTVFSSAYFRAFPTPSWSTGLLSDIMTLIPFVSLGYWKGTDLSSPRACDSKYQKIPWVIINCLLQFTWEWNDLRELRCESPMRWALAALRMP